MESPNGKEKKGRLNQLEDGIKEQVSIAILVLIIVNDITVIAPIAFTIVLIIIIVILIFIIVLSLNFFPSIFILILGFLTKNFTNQSKILISPHQ